MSVAILLLAGAGLLLVVDVHRKRKTGRATLDVSLRTPPAAWPSHHDQRDSIG